MYRLVARKISLLDGVKYTAATNGGTSDSGEECIAFENNMLSGYGPYIWIMPTADALTNATMITTFDDPCQQGVGDELGGLSKLSTEIDVYTPQAVVALKLSCIQKIRSILDSSAENAYHSEVFLCEVGRLLSKNQRLTDLEFEKIGSSALNDLYPDISLFLTYLEEEDEKLMLLFNAFPKSFAGVGLMNPFVVCMLPESSLQTLYDSINELPISDDERSFMKRQFIPIEWCEEDDSFDPYYSKFELLQSPAHFAEVILENVRSFYSNPDLKIMDVVEILKSKERQIGEGCISRANNGTLVVKH